MNVYSFGERLEFSQGYLSEGIERILQSRIPACVGVVKANGTDDRNGTDYWAERGDGLPSMSIDVKVREKDWAERGKDDLALETWSVIGERIGWTRNPQKRTDYVLWYWQDTGRFVLVSFPALCAVFTRYWEQWSREYETARQDSGGWQSECVFVPRKVIMERITAWSCGKIPRKTDVL